MRSIDPTIPAWLDALVTRCLAPSPAARYERMKDVLAELEAGDHDGRTTAIPVIAPDGRDVGGADRRACAPPRGQDTARWLIVAAAVIVLAGAAWMLRGRWSGGSTPPAAVGAPISLAVLPFRNASGDPTLDSLGSSLSQVLGTELGQSSRVRMVPSDRMHQVLQDLKIEPNSTLAPQELARVADFTNARRVLWGQYSRFGDAIRIDATLQDLDSGQSVPLNAMAANDASLLTAIGQLTDAVRESLAHGSSDMLSELKATSWKPSTSSFDALRLYNEGVRLSEQGAHQDAQKSFAAATKADGNFALAYSGLARAYSTLGYDNEAVQNSNRAMSLSDALPPYERYLISANHYRIVNDTAKAIEAYENLAKAAPNSATVEFDLGGLYEQSGDLDKARAHFAKVVALDPKFVEGQLALGRVDIKRGHAQDALAPLNTALTLAIQLNHDEVRANTLQAIGIAYKQLDRLDEALKNYQESLDIKQRLGNKRGMAGSLSEIAQVQERQGKLKEAEQSYQAALKLQREIGDKAGMSTTLINLAGLLNETLGRPDDALPLLREALQLRRDAGNPAGEAMVLNNIGNVYLAKGDYSEAQTYFERTLELREKANVRPKDLADTLHNLGETLSKEGRYDQALAQYLRAHRFAPQLGRQAGRGHRVLQHGDGLRRAGPVRRRREGQGGGAPELPRVEAAGLVARRDSQRLRLQPESRRTHRTMPPSRWTRRWASRAHCRIRSSSPRRCAFRRRGSSMRATRRARSRSRIRQPRRRQRRRTRACSSRRRSWPRRRAAAGQPTQALAARLAKLSQDADAIGLPSMAVECTVARAGVLLKLGDRAGSRREADRALARAETLGFRRPRGQGALPARRGHARDRRRRGETRVRARRAATE